MQIIKFVGKNKIFIALPVGALMLTIVGFVLLLYDIRWINETGKLYLNIPQSYWFSQLGIFIILVLLIVCVNTFTNALLVYLAYFKLSEESVSVVSGLKQCWSQRYALVSWGIFFTCAGFILSLTQRTGTINSLISWGVKTAWHVSAFLIMPFIIVERLTPSLAFEKSQQYFSSTAVLQVNILMVFALYLLPLAILIQMTAYFPLSDQKLVNEIWHHALFYLFFIWLIAGNAFNAILKTALYLSLSRNKELKFFKKDINTTIKNL